MNNLILDIPYSEPIEVDLDTPLEDQLPKGMILETAKRMVAEYRLKVGLEHLR